ncbi:MAG: superoxide dismutase [Flavobacteriales bacterium]|nr:superoxide dismutase [Flavobacteriales bacterium]
MATSTGGADDRSLQGVSPFELPTLGYEFSALVPHVDAFTMEIHHGKHHGAYVANLNKAIEASSGFLGKTILELLQTVTSGDTAIRNNGGGHWNHSMFWRWIKPGGAEQPGTELMAAITSSFGSMDEFKKQFSESAKTRFGSGWAWLCVGQDKNLFITSTPNQDNPLMRKIAEKSGQPILGIDVWEHAYYLNYQNKRPDYINAFFQIINWDEVLLSYKQTM